jgi:hypothetical protein
MRMHFILALAAIATSGLGLPAHAQLDPAQPTPPPPDGSTAPKVEPKVEQIEKDLFRVGAVTFRPSTREIRFDAKVNMQEGLLEYAIVRENGDKAHEALLSTTALPSDINIALKLLRYPESPELLPLRDESGAFTTKFPDVPEDVRQGARVDIQVVYKVGTEEKKAAINEWIAYDPTQQPMPLGPWLYTGSYVFDGKFAADTVGDLTAIILDGATLFNYPGKDRENDAVWSVMTKRVPAVGSLVTVVITPYPQPNAKAK